MSIEETIRQRVEQVVSEAREARARVEQAAQQASSDLDERAQQAMQEAQDHLTVVQQRANEARDHVQSVLRSPETAQAIRDDAEVIVGWVLSHVEKLGTAGVNVSLPENVREAIQRFGQSE